MPAFKRIHRIYSSESSHNQRKVITLFIINIILGSLFLIFALLRVFQQSYFVAAGEIAVTALLAVNIFLIYRGLYRVSSNISIFLFLGAAFGVFFLQKNDLKEINDIYIFSTYMIAVLSVTPLLAYRLWQMIGVLILGIIGEILLFLFMLYPLVDKSSETSSILIGLFISVLFLAMAGTFSTLIYRTQLKGMEALKEEKDNASRNLNTLNRIVESMKNSFNVGEKLLHTAGETSKSSQEMSRLLTELDSEADKLSEATQKASETYSLISESEGSVKESMANQTQAIDRSSAVIEQIISNIKTVSHSASEKVDVLTGLNTSSRTGSEKLENTVLSLKNLSNSSSDILEIIQVIEDVSSQTNLLAMNAAIEAAHAGDSGKGFAVVADEIRKLSETTAENSNAIRRSIENNNSYLMESDESILELQKVFIRFTSQVEEVGLSLKDMTLQMSELLSGTGTIVQAIQDLLSSNNDVKNSLALMEKNIGLGDESVGAIRQALLQTKNNLDAIIHLGESIETETAALEVIGSENVENVNKLYSELEEIHE